MNKLKTIFVVMLIISLFGIGICNLISRDWKEATLGILLGVVNILIFTGD